LFICIIDNGNVIKSASREKHTESYYLFGLVLMTYVIFPTQMEEKT